MIGMREKDAIWAADLFQGSVCIQFHQRFDMTVANVVNPAMQPKRLAVFPRAFNYIGSCQVDQLIPDIHFNESVELGFLTIQRCKFIGMIAHNATRMIEPLPELTGSSSCECPPDATTPIMTAHNDVRNLEHLDCILQRRHQVEIARINKVGDVAVNEHTSRRSHGHLFRADPAVRATDPQERWLLAVGLSREKVCALVDKFLRPSPVGDKKRSRPSMRCNLGCGHRAAWSGGLGCNL